MPVTACHGMLPYCSRHGVDESRMSLPASFEAALPDQQSNQGKPNDEYVQYYRSNRQSAPPLVCRRVHGARLATWLDSLERRQILLDQRIPLLDTRAAA